MTPSLTTHLRELLSKATPGRWMSAHIHHSWVRADTGDRNFYSIVGLFSEDRPEANADLIAAAINALPQLLAVVEAAQALSDQLETHEAVECDLPEECEDAIGELNAALSALTPTPPAAAQSEEQALSALRDYAEKCRAVGVTEEQLRKWVLDTYKQTPTPQPTETEANHE